MNILYPVFAMALLTFAVGPVLLAARISSVRSGMVHMEYYEVFQGGEPSVTAVKTARHLSNLFEAPVLFYVACLMAYSLHLESAFLVVLAWAYVAARVMHSMIHLTYNRVSHRMTAFLVSQFFLMVMWVLIFIQAG